MIFAEILVHEIYDKYLWNIYVIIRSKNIWIIEGFDQKFTFSEQKDVYMLCVYYRWIIRLKFMFYNNKSNISDKIKF